MRATFLLLAGVASATQELTPDNFDQAIFGSGKSGFVKVRAPTHHHLPPAAPVRPPLNQSPVPPSRAVSRALVRAL